MSEPFIGEIRIFGGNFAPRSFAFCNGQLLPISQNTALFSILGTIYGGDGRSTFALPDLRGRAAIGSGRGPGLSEQRLGQKTGADGITLAPSQIPPHTHQMVGSSTSVEDGEADPTGRLLGSSEEEDEGLTYHGPQGLQNFASDALSNTGDSQPHSNMQPFIAVNYIIALQGLYPSRS
ncbi:MAG: tail fiber protein [Pseudomonadota bacterium]